MNQKEHTLICPHCHSDRGLGDKNGALYCYWCKKPLNQDELINTKDLIGLIKRADGGELEESTRVCAKCGYKVASRIDYGEYQCFDPSSATGYGSYSNLSQEYWRRLCGQFVDVLFSDDMDDDIQFM